MSDTRTCDGCRALDERVKRLERFLFGEPGVAAEPSDSPLARSMADLVTATQLGNVRRLARRAGVDSDEEARALFGADCASLNRNAADGLIKHLAQLPAAARRERGGA